MKISKKNALVLVVFLYVSTILCQENLKDLGLQAISSNEKAPKAIHDWGRLVGNWDILFESIDQNGNVKNSFNGEWNWFYILNGYAIQDIFILPPRDKVKDPNALFYGSGIRIYNEDSKKWETVWVDTSSRKLEFREAFSEKNKIVLYHNKNSGEKLRITYYGISQTTFKWKQETFDNEKNVWIITQLIHAKRS